MTEVDQLKFQLHHTRRQRETMANQLVDAMVKIEILVAKIKELEKTKEDS